MKKIALVVLALVTVTLAAPTSALAADLAPQFGYVAPGWIEVPGAPFDLTAAWRAFGFQESGASYAFVGGPRGGATTWERFDPDGATYEAFFGAYVIRDFKYAGEWHAGMTAAEVTDSANELIALGVVDQFAWLSFYSAPFGGPTASSYVSGSLHVAGPLPGGSFLLTFLVNTTSDLGADTPPAPFVPPYSLFAGEVPAWQPVTAEAAVLVRYDAPSGDFVAVYGSGALYQVGGQYRNTPAATLLQIGQMMAATTFQ